MSVELISIREASELTGLTVETLRMIMAGGELSKSDTIVDKAEAMALNIHIIEFFSDFSDELKKVEDDILRGKV